MLGRSVTIAASGTLSGSIKIGENDMVGLLIPTIETAICYVNGSLDDITYSRIQKEDGSADLNMASGTGAKAWILPSRFPFPYLKVETSATQTAARVITVCAKK